MKYFFLFSFFFCTCSVLGQNTDLVVTTSGDSVGCKITILNKYSLHYLKYQLYGDPIRRKLSLQDVASYQYDFFEVTDKPQAIPQNKVEPKKKPIAKGERSIPAEKKKKPIRLTINSGVSMDKGTYIVRNSAPLQIGFVDINYKTSIQTGFRTSVNADLYLNEDIGIGLIGDFDVSRAELDRLLPIEIWQFGDTLSVKNDTVSVSNQISTTFLGLSFFQGNTLGKRFNAWYSISAGYLQSKNQYVFIERGTNRAAGFAILSNLNLDYRLTDKIAIGAEVGLMLGLRFYTGQIGDQIIDNRGIRRSNYSLGVHFYL